jgi:hypothetical protein
MPASANHAVYLIETYCRQVYAVCIDLTASAITVMDQPAARGRLAIMQCLFLGIKRKAGMSCSADPPSHNISGIDVDHEGDINKTTRG